jgi:hypothetical protein
MQTRKLAVVAIATVVSVGALYTTATAFDPQPDPPAFGVVSITPDQALRLNAVCAGHGVNGTPPDPCRAELMFHTAAGDTILSRFVELRPGEAAFIDVSPGTRTAAGERVGIIPCIIPGPDSGRLLPTAEVFNTTTGETSLFINPVTPRLTFIKGFPVARMIQTEEIGGR